MSTRRKSASTVSTTATAIASAEPSSIATTSAVKLNPLPAKRKAKSKPKAELNIRPVTSKTKSSSDKGKGKALAPPPSDRRPAWLKDPARGENAEVDDRAASPVSKKRKVDGSSSAFASKGDMLPATGLDGGNLETELMSERGKTKATPLGRPPPKIDFLTFKPRPRPRPSSHLPTSPPRSSSSRSAPQSDSVVAIAVTETPVARKNKEMRMENARRSSLTMRSSRMSSSLTRGEVVMPHASVEAKEFYKHLSPTLPEPIRVKNLLLWCAKRTDLVREKGDTKRGDELCRKIMDGLVEVIGRGRVDINVFSGGSTSTSGALSLQPHPQNVLNAKRKAREEAHVDQCKRESEQWNTIGKRANAKHAEVVKSLLHKREPEVEGDDWIGQASRAADEVLAEAVEDLGELGDVEFKVDTLLQTTHTAMQYSLHATRFLDGVFSSLAQDLRVRGKTSERAKADPLAMLRALAKADAPHASQETIAAATAMPLPPPQPMTTPRRPAAGVTPSRRAALGSSTTTPRSRGTPFRPS